jgi:hypothetical protein
MESFKLTDEELIELAKNCNNNEDEEVWDVRYYQETFNITSGTFKLSIDIVYYHYKNWSVNPVSIEQFFELLKLEKKNFNYIHIDRKITNLNITKLIGDHVKVKKKSEKEERFRKISSVESKIKR